MTDVEADPHVLSRGDLHLDRVGVARIVEPGDVRKAEKPGGGEPALPRSPALFPVGLDHAAKKHLLAGPRPEA